MCVVSETDSVYSETTLALNASSDMSCDVLAVGAFRNRQFKKLFIDVSITKRSEYNNSCLAHHSGPKTLVDYDCTELKSSKEAMLFTTQRRTKQMSKFRQSEIHESQ